MAVYSHIILKPNERIVRVYRRFPWVDIWRYAAAAVFLLLPFFFLFPLLKFGTWGMILIAALLLVGIGLLARTIFFWFHNVFVITTDRIVDVHRLGWFEEIISAVSHLDIKDISVRKKGIAQSLLNFGGLAIQTKSQQFILEILNISNPAQVQLMLTDVGQQYKQDVKVANTRVIYNNFLKIIPDLPDGDLQETRDLIEQQIGRADDGEVEEEMVQ